MKAKRHAYSSEQSVGHQVTKNLWKNIMNETTGITNDWMVSDIMWVRLGAY